MAPDCICERCVDRRSMCKTPLHLKSYDTSTGPRLRYYPPPVFSHHGFQRRHLFSPDTSKVPDCKCTRCLDLRTKYKPPIHLKRSDDTINTPWRCICVSECKISTCAEACRCTRCGYDDVERSAKNLMERWNLCSKFESLRRRNPSLWTFESAYLEPNLSVFPGEHFEYDNCTPKQLKKFVQDRRLKDPFPEGLTLKSTYIRILIAADKVWKFRFLDLPPEMRNLIYDELLIRKAFRYPWNKVMHPQVLSACREVHSEASEILYAENVLTCEFSVHYDEFGDVEPYILLVQQELYDTQWFVLPKSALHRINTLNIKIRVNLEDDDQEHACGFMPNTLLVFASSFMSGHAWTRVNIDLSFVHKDDDLRIDAAAILYPLRRLRGIKKVQVTGDLPIELAEAIQHDMQSSKPSMNTLWRQQAAKMRGWAYLRHYRLQHDKSDSIYEDGSLEQRIFTKSKELRGKLDNEGPPLYVDERCEAEALQTIKELEALFSGVSFDKFAYHQDESVKQHKEDMEYFREGWTG